jgi:hypothetical protein
MKDYRLTILRTVQVSTCIYIEGDSAEDAIARFDQQLENDDCPAIEDEANWGEAFYYQVTKAGPYASEYEVLAVVEEQ